MSNEVKRTLTWSPRIVYLLVVITSFVALFTFHINDHDVFYFSDSFLAFLRGEYHYEYTDGLIGFMNPPHAAYLYPLLWHRVSWAAFWLILTITLIYIGNAPKPQDFIARLLFLLTPYFLYVIAAVNLYIATAIGLYLLLNRVRGIGRGVMWVLLLVRPQDSVLWLVYDGIRALRERDWTAIGTAIFIAGLPALHAGPGIYRKWFDILLWFNTARADLPQISANAVYGSWLAIILSLFITAMRAFYWQDNKFQRRNWQDITQTEILWLLFVWSFSMGYGSYTMIWMFLLPIRIMPARRNIILYAMLMPVSMALLSSWDVTRASWGVFVTIFLVSILLPHTQNAEEQLGDNELA